MTDTGLDARMKDTEKERGTAIRRALAVRLERAALELKTVATELAKDTGERTKPQVDIDSFQALARELHKADQYVFELFGVPMMQALGERWRKALEG